MVSTEIKPGRNYEDDFFTVHWEDSEQDHLWNLIILGVYPKRHPNVHVLLYIISCNPKSDQWFFFLNLTVRGPFHRKDFKSENMGLWV